MQVAIKQDNKDKLKGNVDADKTLVGGGIVGAVFTLGSVRNILNLDNQLFPVKRIKTTKSVLSKGYQFSTDSVVCKTLVKFR